MMVFLPGASRRMPTERRQEKWWKWWLRESRDENPCSSFNSTFKFSEKVFGTRLGTREREPSPIRFYADPRGSLGHSSDIRK